MSWTQVIILAIFHSHDSFVTDCIKRWEGYAQYKSKYGGSQIDGCEYKRSYILIRLYAAGCRSAYQAIFMVGMYYQAIDSTMGAMIT